MANSASPALSQSGAASQCANSELLAATMASASGHQGLAAAGAAVLTASASSGVKSKARIAARMAGKAAASCLTVSTRCNKLNCKSCTPDRLPSFLRSSVSSVGQSICMMRIGVRAMSPTCVAARLTVARGIGLAQAALPQSAACSCGALGSSEWECGWGCGCVEAMRLYKGRWL